MKVIQINLNHCEAAHDLLTQTARKEKADVVLISDPYKTPKSNNWIHDKDKLASIWICGRHAFQSSCTSKTGFVRAKINGVNFYSCYAPPRFNSDDFQVLLDEITIDALGKGSTIIGGDFNAWSTEWGSRLTNLRGQAILESFAVLGLGVANRGNALTFRRSGIGSIVDITLASTNLLRNIKWNVSEEYSGSDHQAIIFRLNSNKPQVPPTFTGPKWKDTALDRETFKDIISDNDDLNGSSEVQIDKIVKTLTCACDASMPRRIQSKRGSPCYWWNDEIKDLRKNCLNLRRKSQRARGRANFEHLCSIYRDARQTLCKAIKNSKRICFKKLMDEADINPWGTAYRIAMTKIKGDRSPQIMCPILVRNVVETLFPTRPLTHFNIERIIQADTIPQVTEREILAASRRIGDKKTPGPDGIPNIALKLAINTRPDMFAKGFNACLHDGVFPERWKLQHLVLLPKGKGDHGDPSSYRPICLLDSLGKILERIIYDRLLNHAVNHGGISSMQFGFMKGRSTIEAIQTVLATARAAIAGTRWRGGDKEYCAVVTLDVKNAFNTADWACIRRSLNRMSTPPYLMKIIESYFTNRKLRYNTDDGMKYHTITAGVPQGSVLGPLLWNIMYDGILRLELPPRTKVVGFADDIAALIVAKTLEDITSKANEAIRIIRAWLDSSGLRLADHKTEVVLITSRRQVEYITLTVGQESIQSKNSVKYLGVMLDNRLNFREHIIHASDKASKVQGALSRIMPNVGGPKFKRRVLLARVVSSILLYAAPIWSKALLIRDRRKRFSSVYRISALRAICGFRTISHDAALVLAGMIPIDILADEVARIYQRKLDAHDHWNQIKDNVRDEERNRSLATWNSRWQNSTKGRWTYRLIPDISIWLNRTHGEPNYQLTQFLTGHGGYRYYLHRFKLDDSPFCPQCGTNEDAEHVIFGCSRFQTDMNCTVENFVSYMIQSEDRWTEVSHKITEVNMELRRIEKQRRQNSTTDVVA